MWPRNRVRGSESCVEESRCEYKSCLFRHRNPFEGWSAIILRTASFSDKSALNSVRSNEKRTIYIYVTSSSIKVYVHKYIHTHTLSNSYVGRTHTNTHEHTRTRYTIDAKTSLYWEYSLWRHCSSINYICSDTLLYSILTLMEYIVEFRNNVCKGYDDWCW